jgi:DNA polymerase-1
MSEDREIDKLLDVLGAREEKQGKKKTRTKAATEVKKAKKLTKKEQQVIDIEKAIVMPDNYILINTPELLEKVVTHYKMYKTMYAKDAWTFLDTETYGLNNWKDGLISIQLGFMTDYYFYIPMKPFQHPASAHLPALDFNVVADALRPLLEADKMIVMANAKFDIHVLFNWANIDITWNIAWDVTIAGKLLNENKPGGLKDWYNNYALPDMIAKGTMSKEELSRPTFKFGSLFDKIPYDTIPHRLAIYYGAHDVFMTQKVFLYQREIYENPVYGLERVYKLFREIEMPLIPIFSTAERRGVAIDSHFLLETIGKVLSQKLKEILEGFTKIGKDGKPDEYVKGIYDYLGKTITLKKSKTRQKQGIKYKEEYDSIEKLNLGSPAQVSQKLYVEHRILEPVDEYDRDLKKMVKKTPTSKKVLTRSKKAHPVVPLLLEYRGLSKLIDAFCNKLPGNAVDGIIHASYNQLVRTGRVSCSMPNLQQIPSRFDLIRAAFRAPEGRVLASCDFSQQELRWLAIFTQEPALYDVFMNGLDMHSKIACQIHGLDYDFFEEVRNYKQETPEETKVVADEIIAKWLGRPEVAYSIAYMNSKENGSYEVGTLTQDLVDKLSGFFDNNLRKKAKSVSFGVVYGITNIGLADQIEGTKEEAQSLIDGFKAGLPYYLRWEASVHRQVINDGFVEDVLGRKRRFGEVIAEAMAEDIYKKRGWHWKIERSKRQSCNAMIQGSSATQTKKAMIDLFYPRRLDGTTCFDREEWLANSYVSQLEKDDVHIVLQVHDELVFDAPMGTNWNIYTAIAQTMCDTIPNDAGILFKSDVEVSPYWSGKFNATEINDILSGKLNWHEVFEKEVQKKLAKFGIEYEIGVFELNDDDDEDEEAEVTTEDAA